MRPHGPGGAKSEKRQSSPAGSLVPLKAEIDEEAPKIVEGSLLIMMEGMGVLWLVPASRQGGAFARRICGELCVGVSCDGAELGASYVKLSTLSQHVEAVAPAITRKSAHRGGVVWTLPGKQEHAVLANVGRLNEGRMAFTLVAEDDG